MTIEILGLTVDPEDAQSVLYAETTIVQMLVGLASMGESFDTESAWRHNMRCYEITKAVMYNLNKNALPPYDLDIFSGHLNKKPFYMALVSSLHDIGKSQLPQHILNKPSQLTAAEFELIKEHTTSPLQYFEQFETRGNDFLQLMRDCTRHHHEKYDGTGYPDGLAETEIPFIGRLVAVVDVLDNLLTPSVYRQQMSLDEAFNILLAESGTRFDPNIVDAALRSRDKISAIMMT
jgi:putative two-component system response regulator